MSICKPDGNLDTLFVRLSNQTTENDHYKNILFYYAVIKYAFFVHASFVIQIEQIRITLLN